MNKTELKLSLVEAFAKPATPKIEYTKELFDALKVEFWISFKSTLDSSIKNRYDTFRVSAACISWWSPRNPVLNAHKDTPYSERNAAFYAFASSMADELKEIGMPFTLEKEFSSHVFLFCLADLKKYSNAEQLLTLK